MIWYNLRKDGKEVRVGNVDELIEWQDKGYMPMSIIDTADVSKCKEVKNE